MTGSLDEVSEGWPTAALRCGDISLAPIKFTSGRGWPRVTAKYDPRRRIELRLLLSNWKHLSFAERYLRAAPCSRETRFRNVNEAPEQYGSRLTRWNVGCVQRA